VFESPNHRSILEIIDAGDSESIHMMAGWRGLRNGRFLLEALRKRRARTGLIVEGVDPAGWAGLVRRGVYILELLRLRNGFDFILAMGTLGTEWFSRCGYPAKSLFPYGYITEKPVCPPSEWDAAAPYQLLFLGQLVRRKGVDLLLRALAGLRSLPWRLTVVGSGEDESSLPRLASDLGLSDQARFVPAMAYRQAMKELCNADLLVLPSRHDGWGAVVNEALMAGVPVVCSDRCGARDLIKCGARDLVGSGERGEVFRSGSVQSLRDSLIRRLSLGKRTPEITRTIRAWASCIDGERGADYVQQVLAHVYKGAPRPAPLWQWQDCDR
jgi:glycosyltransferase involved in cell wall biosynthesis